MRPMDSEFHRVKRLPRYVFSEVNNLKAEARAAGRDIIDFGMGNPDQPPPRHVADKLVETLQDPRVHRYSNSRGIPGLRRALAAYYARRFGVELDPEREAIVTLGSKAGLANLAQAITSPGDGILAPNPSYPIHAFGSSSPEPRSAPSLSAPRRSSWKHSTGRCAIRSPSRSPSS
jgi:alanine-synthesizing transaminase